MYHGIRPECSSIPWIDDGYVCVTDRSRGDAYKRYIYYEHRESVKKIHHTHQRVVCALCGGL